MTPTAAFERARSDHGARWRWEATAITVGVDDVTLSGLPPDLVADAFARAAEVWSRAGCGISLARAAPGQRPDVTLRFAPELPRRMAAETTREGDTYRGVLAHATLTLSAAFSWGLAAPLPEGALDLETLLVHELGHALGLAHSFDRRAVMRAGAKPLRVRRALHADDQRGLCSIYPPLKPARP